MTTPEEAVEVLNRALTADPVAMNALLELRVPCNDALADDPTVQVRLMDKDSDSPYPAVGILGLLNGVFGIRENTQGWIAAWRDTKDGPYTRFCITKSNSYIEDV